MAAGRLFWIWAAPRIPHPSYITMLRLPYRSAISMKILRKILLKFFWRNIFVFFLEFSLPAKDNSFFNFPFCSSSSNQLAHMGIYTNRHGITQREKNQAAAYCAAQ
jgi:hypothetical protein